MGSFGRKLLGGLVGWFLPPLSYLPFLISIVRFELDSFRKTLLWIAILIPSCVASWDLPCLLAGTRVTVVCCVVVVYLQRAGEKQQTSTELHSQTAAGYYYPYGFDWKLPRIWKPNLIVEIWKKQWIVFSLEQNWARVLVPCFISRTLLSRKIPF